MNDPSRTPQITVLDAGGQYCHLIARKVRDLGVYSEVRPSDTPAECLRDRRGVIISGGPSSVYDPGSPVVDPALFTAGPAILGICYGQQLMAHNLGGVVQRGEKGEYGLATLRPQKNDGLFQGIADPQKVWMSHRDVVAAVPPGFETLGSTDTCAIASMAAPDRRLYAVQFHPEVIHTTHGLQILSNFLFHVCSCEKDWDPIHRLDEIEASIRKSAAGHNVFFFVSGGVDSTVAYTLCLRALGPGRVRGVYVDTGLMRQDETEFVRSVFHSLDARGTVDIEMAAAQFLGALEGVHDPETKRHRIGEEFLKVQERIVEGRQLADGHWLLGQGTIYPDTIESGGTEKAATIKTHHNRVAGIQRLLEAGLIVEPLASFYKDEVRQIGRQLGLPRELLERQPFPGPGLAIRCLCSEQDGSPQPHGEGWILPVRSVGVQGDERTYASVLALEEPPSPKALAHATELINQLSGINRVIAFAGGYAPPGSLHVHRSNLTANRLDRLREVDAIVRRVSHKSGFDNRIWQFPVVLIPAGTEDRPDSVVLRPVDSVDGMTAEVVLMDPSSLMPLTEELLNVPGICAVFYDLTHKPPGTIEWE